MRCTIARPHQLELRRRVRAALGALPPLAEEAAQAGGCWRHPFPSAAVVAVCAARRGMLEALDLMHTTLTALQPGEATSLIQPLLQPLNRVEAQVAHSLRAILQRLRAGSATHDASPESMTESCRLQTQTKRKYTCHLIPQCLNPHRQRHPHKLKHNPTERS